jgi:hypothetical protein
MESITNQPHTSTCNQPANQPRIHFIDIAYQDDENILPELRRLINQHVDRVIICRPGYVRYSFKNVRPNCITDELTKSEIHFDYYAF